MNSKINTFNSYLLLYDFKDFPLGLFFGKMGISIYLYHQAAIYKDKRFSKLADNLLSNVVDNIKDLKDKGLESGILGVGIGIEYLFRQKIIKGNPNIVLKDVDSIVYSLLANDFLNYNNSAEDIKNKHKILNSMGYFLLRLNDEKLSQTQRKIFEDILIKSVNYIEQQGGISCIEPPSFSISEYLLPKYIFLLSVLYQMSFYNYKLDKVFEGLSYQIISNIPLLHCNRLLLYCSISKILRIKPLDKWKKHNSILEKNIDISFSIHDEFKEKYIGLDNGISGLLLLSFISDFDITDNIQILQNRIDIQISKNELPQIGLMNGLCGSILAYQYFNS